MLATHSTNEGVGKFTSPEDLNSAKMYFSSLEELMTSSVEAVFPDHKIHWDDGVFYIAGEPKRLADGIPAQVCHADTRFVQSRL